MDNYASVVAQVLASFPSQKVPSDREEEGKAQLTRVAAWQIHQQNPNVGLLSKPGGNQVGGLAVDVLIDRSDGSSVDCASSTPDGAGSVRIRAVWLPNAPNPDAVWLARWVQPTAALAGAPGPLKSETPPQDGVREQIRALYLEVLWREPDQAGWDHWTREVEVNRLPLAEVREALKRDPGYPPQARIDPEVNALVQKVLVEFKRHVNALDALRRDLDNTGKLLTQLAAGAASNKPPEPGPER